jgi:hypothetical protein
MAFEIIPHLVRVLDELIFLLTCDKRAEGGGQWFTWRLEWLRRIRELLYESPTKELLWEIAREIQEVMRGGMGSFLDIYLDPKAECGLSKEEINERFVRLTNELYDLHNKIIGEIN